MSVTAPQGFEAAGVAVGLKSTGKPDVAVVVNRGPRKVGAAVFTSNRAKANPILGLQQVIADSTVEAIVLNSGGANCFTGAFGFQTSRLTAEKAAGPKRQLRGLVATGRGIPRPHMSVSLTPDVLLGEVTSGTFSPTLRKGIGLALIPSFVDPDAEVGVDIRGRREIFQLVKPPFVDPSVRES